MQSIRLMDWSENQTFRPEDKLSSPNRTKTEILSSDRAAFATLQKNIRSRLEISTHKRNNFQRQIQTADKFKKISTESSQYDQDEGNSIRLKPLLSKKQSLRPKTTGHHRPRFMTEQINSSPISKYTDTNKFARQTAYQEQLNRVITYEQIRGEGNSMRFQDHQPYLNLPRAQLVELVPMRKAPKFFKSKQNCRYTSFFNRIESNRKQRDDQQLELLSITQLNKSIDSRIFRIFSTFKNTFQ